MTTLDLITKEDLQQFKDELFAELRQLNNTAGDGNSAKKWMKSIEVREMLDISPGTLQNLRINGTLRFTKVGSLMFYKREDIEKILEDNLSANK
ncbi:MAG: DNA-binding protein [Chryseobacterium sp.]|nr:MAG: DNA-binding protein [Chryseobacterium sp.]